MSEREPGSGDRRHESRGALLVSRLLLTGGVATCVLAAVNMIRSVAINPPGVTGIVIEGAGSLVIGVAMIVGGAVLRRFARARAAVLAAKEEASRLDARAASLGGDVRHPPMDDRIAAPRAGDQPRG